MAFKPTLLVVPGSFSPVTVYDDVVASVRAKGYEIQAVEIPTVGRKPGKLPTMYDDAEKIREIATKTADEGRDVVLVAHSYGGVPATESMKGISKKERESQGKKGGVVRLAYMTACVLEVGAHTAGFLADIEMPEMMKPDEEGWMYHPDRTVTAKIICSDLSPEEGLKVAQLLQEHSSVSFMDQLTYPGYNDVPSSYLFCEEDRCVIPIAQQRGIDMIQKSGGKVDVTRIPNDHMPTHSAPGKVVDWLVSVADRGERPNEQI